MTVKHVANSASHRWHGYANEVGLPLQEPGAAVSCWPTFGVPEIVGGAVFLGAELEVAGATAAVWADCAGVDPSALVVVTRTRIVLPASAPTSVYVFCVSLAT